MKKKWTIKSFAKEIVSSLLILFVLSMAINYIRKPDISENIYSLNLVDINNDKINFSAYDQGPLVVHFWATWCPTCKMEASNIERISKSNNVISIAVSSGSNEKITSYMNDKSLTYPVINDANGALANKFNIGAYPTTLIYNSKGELKFTEVGYSTTLGLKARLALID